MAHQALARKYRPRRFSEVATQKHVSETLRHAVSGGRVAHAYLFCGPRGVGKTTLARVLAMALNCPDRAEDGEPCGVCESCARIWGGHTALDVVEIDAASNRGVDDARDLRERAMYAPSEDNRYKVYIVDEAHMLTREAWNALLKILEEPPPRVIFVFATTEPQKIQQSAAPILSRCQRFDFRRIGVSDILERLSRVIEAEGAAAPEEALRTIARKADGGMRDGLSLLDQVLSLTGGDVDTESVRRVLGLVEEERYLELFDIIREGRHGDVFTLVEALLDEGYDLTEFYHGLVDVLRALLRIRLSDDEDAGELRPDLREAFAERARAFGPGDLVRMLALASELESSGSLRRSAQPRMLLEMLLLRLSYLDRTVALEELVRGLGGAPRGGPAGSDPGRPSPSEPALPASSERISSPPDAEAGEAEASSRPVTEGAETAGAVEKASEEEAPSEPPETRDVASPDLATAWASMLESGRGVPPGFSPLLRAAAVSEGEGGRIEVLLPEGPALERLQDSPTLRQVAGALGATLGREVELDVRASGPQGGVGHGRITQESVRRGRLRELVEREPLLERAVEELDLELLE
jgi:DNA polymerase-3 subunit gamma/tau